MNQVDEQTLDVRAVMILVRHQHNGAIPELRRAIVLGLHVEAHDCQKIGNLRVTNDLLEVGISHVENLALQREDSELVAADNAEPCDCQRLGRVALCQDQGAVLRVTSSGIVGIFELRDAKHPGGVLGCASKRLGDVHLLLGLHPVQDGLHNTTLQHLLHHFLRYLAAGTKLTLLGCQRLLCLGIKSWVLNHAVDEDPKMIPNVSGLDVDATSILALDDLEDGLNELICDM
mmetsp:Transcript_48734/g.87597  ORF Transcript_48734/g.87597 Transcript_48734/m.87597 type:complete len:231 (-) Transcript_48734:1005-1697(-)